MIKVALGTENFQFTRLMEWLDRAIDDKIFSDKEEILVQVGSTNYTPRHNNIKQFATVPYQQQMEEFKVARISIIHAGIGNVLDMVDIERMPIIVPRDPALNEHIDGHQLDFCEVAKIELGLPIAYSYEQFVELVKNYNTNATFPTYRKQLVDYLISVVEAT